jgi:tRNA threonylcarbamoyladenosine modification (KEOPS) complex  Pcc1 subunit
MNDKKNLPLQAEIIEIRVTAEEARKLRSSIGSKVTVIKKAIDPSEMRIPQGPMRIGGTWYV